MPPPPAHSFGGLPLIRVCPFVKRTLRFVLEGIVNPEQELLTAWINETFYQRNGKGLDDTSLNLFWSFTVSSVAVGAIVGALLTRPLAEHLGRRNGLIANAVVNVVAALMEYCSKYAGSPELLVIGRVILGANMGLTSGLVPMYLMEITPNRYRGTAGTFHQVAVAFSDWFSLLLGLPEVLGSAEHWPIAFGFPGILALLLVIILPFCPESPKYTLVSLGKREETFDALERLVDQQEARSMFEALVKEAALLQEGTGTYKELFTLPQFRIPLLVSVIVMVAQQFTGCSTVFAYSTDMFLNAELSPPVARYSTLAVGIAYFLFALSAPFLIERAGRRVLSLFQLSSIAVALTLLTIFTWIRQSTQSHWPSYGTIGALIFYMCAYGVGSPIPWMITSELFPTKFRSAAVTVAVFVAWFLAFVISTLYLPFQQLVGISLSYLPFICVTILSTIFVYCMMPETRNKQATEIIEEFRYRTQSLAHGRPFRTMPMSVPEESRRLIRSDSSSTTSYHRYMSIGG
ncbi:Protein F53H8.3 [Aphelenchoides avenae]|nr:Protein F53H8.3 [Aphelenchus avenae]